MEYENDSSVDLLDRYCTTPSQRHDEEQPPATIEEEKSVWDCCWCCCPCFMRKPAPPMHCTEGAKVLSEETSSQALNSEPDVEQTQLSPMWWKKQQQYLTQQMERTPGMRSSRNENDTPDVRAVARRESRAAARNIHVPETPREHNQAIHDVSRTPDPGESRFA